MKLKELTRMIRNVIAVFFAFFLTGCIHTQMVPQEEYPALNHTLATKKGIINLKNGLSFNAQHIQIHADSTSWIMYQDKVPSTLSISTSEVESIQLANRGKGVLLGLGIGAITGVAIGRFMGGSYGDSERVDVNKEARDKCYAEAETTAGIICGFLYPAPLNLSSSEKATIGGIGVGFIGVLVGPILGAIIAGEDYYILNSETSNK